MTYLLSVVLGFYIGITFVLIPLYAARQEWDMFIPHLVYFHIALWCLRGFWKGDVKEGL